MNTAPAVRSDVEQFVAAVREHFSDLDAAEREELLGGLEADTAIGLGDVLDDVHRSWDRALDALPGSPRGFIESLQPVWWVLRAVAALGGGARTSALSRTRGGRSAGCAWWTSGGAGSRACGCWTPPRARCCP